VLLDAIEARGLRGARNDALGWGRKMPGVRGRGRMGRAAAVEDRGRLACSAWWRRHDRSRRASRWSSRA